MALIAFVSGLLEFREGPTSLHDTHCCVSRRIYMHFENNGRTARCFDLTETFFGATFVLCRAECWVFEWVRTDLAAKVFSQS